MRAWTIVSAILYAAAQEDTDPICIGYNQTYQTAMMKCKQVISKMKDSDGQQLTLTSQRDFCQVTECQEAIAASLKRKIDASGNSACKRLEVSAWPTLYCSTDCFTTLAQFSNVSNMCNQSTIAQLESYCHTCEDMFMIHPIMNQKCGVNSATDTSYITEDNFRYKGALDYCKATFKNTAFNFTPDPNLVPEASKTTTYIGIGAGVVVVILIVAGVIVYRRRQQKPKGVTRSGSGGGYYSNNRTPYSGTNGSGGNTLGTRGAVVDDIRFDPDLARYRIPQEQIQNVTLLVKGGYGVVFRASCNGIDVAMKQLLPSKAKDQHAIQEFMNEIRLCARLVHPKIVKFVGVSWSTLHDLAVLSEFMPNGDVTDLLKAERKKNPKDRAFTWLGTRTFATSKTAVAADVADALAFLHSFEPTIIHRDLKSKNVLMSANWEAKLSDFGISRVTSTDDTMTSNIGTVAWIAPEVLTSGHYSEKADIYSFGVFLSELDTLESPYAEMSEKNAGGFSNARIAMMVSEGALQPSFTDSVPNPILDLARQCLSFHDVNRPSAQQVASILRSFL